MKSKWLKPEDVADLLQISRSYAYEIIKDFEKQGGTVWHPSKRVTRVKPEEFEKFLAEKK